MATVHDATNGAALESFVLQSKSAPPRMACDLIRRATSEPGLFVFGELLDLESIQAVRMRALAELARA